MVFIRESIIAKKLTEIESKTSEAICIKFQVLTKKCSILFACRPQKFNKNDFFNEISNSLNKISNKYENIPQLDILTLIQKRIRQPQVICQI